MSVFQPPEIVTDPAALAANAKAYLASVIPGWTAQPGNIEDVLIDAFSFPMAEQNEILASRLTAQYRSLGPLIGVYPIEALPATATATITVGDTLGHTLVAGSLLVGIRDTNGVLQGFRLPANLEIKAGTNTATATLEAEEPGTGANGLSGTGELVTAPPYVTGVVLGASGGGTEAETEAEYLDRLTEALVIQKPGPVLATDAAAIARAVPGVGRATAVNLLKPGAADGGEGSEETNVEKCVTVACTDVNGVASSAEVLAKVLAALQALREVNFKYFAVKPHYWKIDVSTTVYAWPGEEAAAVKAAVEAALKNVLSPARWATDSTGNAERWTGDPVVRQGELYAAVAAVPGVRWASTLTFGKTGSTLGTSDVTIEPASKVPALPEPGAITVVVEPST